MNMKNEKEKRQSGFEDLTEDEQHKTCTHIEHDPPGHLVIPAGKKYRHVCPSCGREVILYPSATYCHSG